MVTVEVMDKRGVTCAYMQMFGRKCLKEQTTVVVTVTWRLTRSLSPAPSHDTENNLPTRLINTRRTRSIDSRFCGCSLSPCSHYASSPREQSFKRRLLRVSYRIRHNVQVEGKRHKNGYNITVSFKVRQHKSTTATRNASTRHTTTTTVQTAAVGMSDAPLLTSRILVGLCFL